MKKRFLKISILIITLFISILNVDAASYTIAVNTTNPIKGSSITLTIRGTDIAGRFNITSSNSGVVSVSESRVWVENNTVTIRLNAVNTGSSTITVTPSDVSDGSGNKASVSAKSVRINVTLPREKSNDNNLKSLAVEGYTLSPEFNKDIQVYKATIPEGTKSINIIANANDRYASVTGTGVKELENGINTFNVIVKSETGIEKIYTINIDVKDENPIIVNVDNKEYTVIKLKEYLTKPENYEETIVTINDFEIPAFVNNKAGITLVGLKNSDGIIKLFQYKDHKYLKYNEMNLNDLFLIPMKDIEELNLPKKTVNINGETFNGYQYSDNDNFTIISAKNLKNGKISLYLYDSENNSAVKFDEDYLNKTNNTIKTYTYIIFAFAGSVFLMFIIIISLLHSSRKKQKKINKFIERQEEKLEATRKLNDVIDEVNNIANNGDNVKEIEKVEIKETLVDDNHELTKMLDTLNNENNNLSKKELKKLKKKEKKKNKSKDKESSEEVYDLFNDD